MEYKNTAINYTVSGCGDKVVLFLHGWAGSISSFEGLQKILSKDYTCINLDFPPFGKSATPTTPWTVQDYAVMVIGLLDKLNINKVNIVCHSFGARVAIYIASLTSRVDKLIITGGAGVKPRPSIKRSFKVFKFKLAKFAVKLKLAKPTFLDRFGSDDYRVLPPVMKQTFKNIVNFDQTDMLKYIKCATLLFWGDKDNQTPLYMARTMAKHIPDYALLVYSGGHFVYLQHFSIFVRVVKQFLI